VNCDVWTRYAEVNSELDLKLDNDRNVEDPILIVGVRKWSYEDLGEDGPTWPRDLGFDLAEHVRVHDKYDLFIYTQ
jgi:hypothetical protein